jgi:hypothetical protein
VVYSQTEYFTLSQATTSFSTLYFRTSQRNVPPFVRLSRISRCGFACSFALSRFSLLALSIAAVECSHFSSF